ncbi:hypothetical protein ACFX16_028189 [Malus domestica]
MDPDWGQLSSKPREQCNQYHLCGANGKCTFDNYQGRFTIASTMLNGSSSSFSDTSSGNQEEGNDGKWKTPLIVVVSITILFSGILLVGYIRRKMKNLRKKIELGERDQSNEGEGKENLELPLFDWNEIASVTENFSTENKVGEGSFGPVYRGTLADGQEIVVKRLSRSSGQGLDEFMNEVVLIAKLQHQNLVKVLGGCIHG